MNWQTEDGNMKYDHCVSLLMHVHTKTRRFLNSFLFLPYKTHGLINQCPLLHLICFPFLFFPVFSYLLTRRPALLFQRFIRPNSLTFCSSESTNSSANLPPYFRFSEQPPHSNWPFVSVCLTLSSQPHPTSVPCAHARVTLYMTPADEMA